MNVHTITGSANSSVCKLHVTDKGRRGLQPSPIRSPIVICREENVPDIICLVSSYGSRHITLLRLLHAAFKCILSLQIDLHTQDTIIVVLATLVILLRSELSP